MDAPAVSVRGATQTHDFRCRGSFWQYRAIRARQNPIEAKRQQAWQISFAILNQNYADLGTQCESEFADFGITA